MDIQKLLNSIEKPKPYDKGTALMWTDPYISQRLLEMHLDPETDIASRRKESIEKTVQWILSEMGNKTCEIMDLGCGPGLYTEKLAAKGHKVTGVDFSSNSIAYAKQSAKQNSLDINYVCMNYLDMDYAGQFDLVIMIYCDFGVLALTERGLLMKKILKALKPGGLFIFDALSQYDIEAMDFHKDWEISGGGFWSDKPYICMNESFHFPENKAILDQHIVLNEQNEYKIYRFWNHYFEEADIEIDFQKAGFTSVQAYSNIIEESAPYNDKGVVFYKAVK